MDILAIRSRGDDIICEGDGLPVMNALNGVLVPQWDLSPIVEDFASVAKLPFRLPIFLHATEGRTFWLTMV